MAGGTVTGKAWASLFMLAERMYSGFGRLPDGVRFVTYRGTGDTIISWKEDFLLSVEDVEGRGMYLEILAEKEVPTER